MFKLNYNAKENIRFILCTIPVIGIIYYLWALQNPHKRMVYVNRNEYTLLMSAISIVIQIFSVFLIVLKVLFLD